MAKGWVAWLGLIAALTAAAAAHAGATDVLLLPTATPRNESPTPSKPRREEELERLATATRLIDLILSETVQDLGFTLELGTPRTATTPSEEELVARAESSWVVAPEVSFERGELKVRIAAVAPGSKVILVRQEHLTLDTLEVGSMHLLRDVVLAGQRNPEPVVISPAPSGQPVARTRSPGRAVLALHGAELGGFAGYAVQRASGSDDARLTYPLTALGAGLGIGASMIVTEEWDLGVGDAWFLSAGIHWPGAGGLLLARGYEVEPTGDHYLHGLLGGVGGLTLAGFAAGFGHVEPGGAALAHSGGLLGTFVGGVVQAGLLGTTTEPVYLGLGYGAIGGAIVGGALGTQYRGAPSRVLFVDLLAGLGGLSGAALASPLLVGEERTATETRGWLASIAIGTALGGVAGLVATRPGRASTRPWSASPPRTLVLPYGGVIAGGLEPESPPFLGAGLLGSF